MVIIPKLGVNISKQKHIWKPYHLVGGWTNPFEKNTLVKIGSWNPNFQAENKKIYEQKPPKITYTYMYAKKLQSKISTNQPLIFFQGIPPPPQHPTSSNQHPLPRLLEKTCKMRSGMPGRCRCFPLREIFSPKQKKQVKSMISVGRLHDFWVFLGWVCDTPWKFNSKSPLKIRPKPKRKVYSLPVPPFFRGELLNFGGVNHQGSQPTNQY